MNRREFLGRVGAAAAVSPLLTGRTAAQVDGLQIGLQTWVFTANTNIPRARALDACIEAMVSLGIRECDVCGPLLDPPDIVERIPAVARGVPLPPDAAAARAAAQQELTRWRASAPMSFYAGVRKKFNDAGISVYAISLFPSNTVEQFTRTMDIAEALGASLVACTAGMSVLPSLVPMAAERKLTIGVQGRPDLSVTDPNVIAKPEQYVAAAALAPHCRVMLDIGDATGRGWDTLRFVQEHGDTIGLLYLKDRRRDYTSVPFGEGDTPIRDIVRTFRDRRYPIRLYLDCEYPTQDRVADLRQSIEYLRAST